MPYDALPSYTIYKAMANLTETQIYFKRGLIITFIAAILFYTGRFMLNSAIAGYFYLFPPQLPPPAASFGALPTLKMSSIKIEGTPSYVLDTENGALPALPDRINVYRIAKPTTNLLSEQTIKQLAGDFSFNLNFIKSGVSKLKWTDGTNSRTFTADIVSKNFQLATGVEKLNTVVNQAVSISNSDAEQMALNFIRSKNLMNPSDLEHMYTTATPSMIILGRLKESKIDPQRSKLMKIDVFRELVDVPANEKLKVQEVKYKVLGPNPRNSLINFYVTNSQKPFQFPIINYTYWDAGYTDKSDYGLTPLPVIWATIAQNKGVISYLRLENEDEFEPFKTNLNIDRIEISDIYLAYYESLDLQEYLQPIYVFEGTFITNANDGQLPQRGEIVLYYPAVKGDFVKN